MNSVELNSAQVGPQMGETPARPRWRTCTEAPDHLNNW
jgi:hypothetical protein